MDQSETPIIVEDWFTENHVKPGDLIEVVDIDHFNRVDRGTTSIWVVLAINERSVTTAMVIDLDPGTVDLAPGTIYHQRRPYTDSHSIGWKWVKR